MIALEKGFKDLKVTTALWMLATILGNPFYNVLAFLICDSLGFSESVSTNTTQVDMSMYFIIVLLIFLIRYVVYRLIYLSKLTYKMDTYYFVEVFFERHKYQVISLFTFFMWASEVEGNIAGFLYFPITILLLCSVSVLTIVRLFKMKKYLDSRVSNEK